MDNVVAVRIGVHGDSGRGGVEPPRVDMMTDVAHNIIMQGLGQEVTCTFNEPPPHRLCGRVAREHCTTNASLLVRMYKHARLMNMCVTSAFIVPVY